MTEPSSSTTIRMAGALGFLGLALGAFGAHLLKPTLLAYNTAAIWETAVLYHLVHAVALLALAVTSRPIPLWTSRLFAMGVVVFSGSLYLLALTNVKWLGAITPLGGLFLLAGWFTLILSRKDGSTGK